MVKPKAQEEDEEWGYHLKGYLNEKTKSFVQVLACKSRSKNAVARMK